MSREIGNYLEGAGSILSLVTDRVIDGGGSPDEADCIAQAWLALHSDWNRIGDDLRHSMKQVLGEAGESSRREVERRSGLLIYRFLESLEEESNRDRSTDEEHATSMLRSESSIYGAEVEQLLKELFRKYVLQDSAARVSDASDRECSSAHHEDGQLNLFENRS